MILFNVQSKDTPKLSRQLPENPISRSQVHEATSCKRTLTVEITNLSSASSLNVELSTVTTYP